MTHNLPDKDDAPWLDTTYDGFKVQVELSKNVDYPREKLGKYIWNLEEGQ